MTTQEFEQLIDARIEIALAQVIERLVAEVVSTTLRLPSTDGDTSHPPRWATASAGAAAVLDCGSAAGT